MNYIPESLNLPQYYRSKTLVTTNCLFQTLLFRFSSFPDCLDRVDPSVSYSDVYVHSLKQWRLWYVDFFPVVHPQKEDQLLASPVLHLFLPSLNWIAHSLNRYCLHHSLSLIQNLYLITALFLWHFWLTPAWSMKPHSCLSLSKPCWVREPLNKEKALKTQFCILGNYCSLLPWSRQPPKSLPKSSAFDHTWAHVQFVADTS